MTLKEKVQQAVDKSYQAIVGIRRHIHQHPELSFEETNTHAYVKDRLNEFGIGDQKDYVKTGILAIIEGKNPEKRTIAIRADMDALPIIEKTDVEFASCNKGVMHACGHDVHTACLLGAAKILNEMKNEFEGRILLIFQPAEEKLPGGAKLMIEEGILNGYNPDFIIAQHVHPEIDAGKVGIKGGLYMASADEIYLTVKGHGGHAAMPHKITDNVLIASHIIVSLQQIVSRKANAAIPTVLSFGKVIAEGATNIIPNEVRIEGTFRTMNEEWRMQAHDLIKQMAKSIAQSMGADCEVDIHKGYPFLYNQENLSLHLKDACIELLGKENFKDLAIEMIAEDFAYFTHHYPSAMFRLGIKPPEWDHFTPLHTPDFYVDEKSIATGTAALVYSSLYLLSI